MPFPTRVLKRSGHSLHALAILILCSANGLCAEESKPTEYPGFNEAFESLKKIVRDGVQSGVPPFQEIASWSEINGKDMNARVLNVSIRVQDRSEKTYLKDGEMWAKQLKEAANKLADLAYENAILKAKVEALEKENKSLDPFRPAK